MRPIMIPRKIYDVVQSTLLFKEKVSLIKQRYGKLRKSGSPDISVVIPAYNEEKNILATLQSLVLNQTTRKVEIIVVNNNSADNTAGLVLSTGVDCITETKQGITAARNTGLKAATGKYILNADADAIYPPDWIDQMIEPLDKNENVSLTYGRFSFIPIGKTGRLLYFFYEYAADLIRYYNRFYKEEAVNVYGFNSGFRRTEGVAVNGFDHPIGANEDGYLALKLKNNGYGKLHYVTSTKALVWTSDRRLQVEGGFVKGVSKRVKKILFPASFVQVRTDL
ncbi:MAG: glycosyltransferase [Chitinophagaceae bacterium]|nr:glycosyltransferase [Chitinophagaceae bacterium]